MTEDEKKKAEIAEKATQRRKQVRENIAFLSEDRERHNRPIWRSPKQWSARNLRELPYDIGRQVWWGRQKANYSKALGFGLASLLYMQCPTFFGPPGVVLSMVALTVHTFLEICMYRHYLRVGADRPYRRPKGSVFSNESMKDSENKDKNKKDDPHRNPYGGHYRKPKQKADVTIVPGSN